jgi:hypothetical protein
MAETATAFTTYVIQTLVSESWRSFETYDTEDSAQDIARKLVEDWGAARVRILGGYFSNEKNRKVYHKVEITDAPQTGFLQKLAPASFGRSKDPASKNIISKETISKTAISKETNTKTAISKETISKAALSQSKGLNFMPAKILLGGSAVSGALLVGSLILFAALPPYSSLADDGQKPAAEITTAMKRTGGPDMTTGRQKKTAAPAVANIAPAPEPVDLQAKFLEIAAVSYSQVKDFDAAPIRLRGPWSIACWEQPDSLVIREHKLDQISDTPAQNIALKDTSSTADSSQTATSTTASSKTAVAMDTSAFSTVWQSGQRYGIHLEDGSVYILDLVSFDQIKPLGTLSSDGDFIAETEATVLNRCI